MQTLGRKATVRTRPASEHTRLTESGLACCKWLFAAGILKTLDVSCWAMSERFTLRLHSRRSRLFLLAGVAALLCLIGAATGVQAQQPEEIITTETSLVQLNVGVVDRQGHAITTLAPSDFAVYEDGVRRQIVHFEPTDTPFSLVLLLDMSGSTIGFRQQILMAAARFLDTLLPDDRVSVVSFNGKGVHNLIGFSLNRKKILYAIEIATGAGETPLYEALNYSLKELAKEGKRRKAIVVMTDGLDTALRNADRAAAANAQSDGEAVAAIKPEASPRLNAVLNEADRLGVTIFPLALPSGDPKKLPLQDPRITGIYAAARKRMDLLANRTGGRLNEIHNLQELARLYAEVAADLRSLYSIAYQPPTEHLHDGRWRAIRIEVTRPDLITRTKSGYYAR
jgi:VWFA-related protein